MKTSTHFFAYPAVLVLAAAMVSCAETLDEPTIEGNTHEIEFICSSDETKTAYHENTIWWSLGDKIRFFQGYYTTEEATKRTFENKNVALSKDASIFSAKISTFTTPAKYPVEYFAVYPSGSYVSTATSTDSDTPNLVRLKLTNTQVPTATSFDPSADLLISEQIVSEEASQTSFKLGFKRLVALGKMKLTNIPTEAIITKVVFSAKKNGNEVNLAGESLFRIENGNYFNKKTSETAIEMDYSSLELSSEMTANFCCYPFELGEGDTFAVTVYTKDEKFYTKEVTIPEGTDLIFERGHGTSFTVNMSNSYYFNASAGTITTNSIVVNYSGHNLSKVTRAFFKASDLSGVSEDEYETKVFTKPSTYGAGLFNALNSTYLAKVNDEGSLGLVYSKNAINTGVNIEPDTEYVLMFKATSTTGATKFVYFNAKTAAEEAATE